MGDRYVLEAKVGEGGMGEVWRGKHLALENEVAIKFLSGSLASNEETKKRFLMEAKLTAQLRSRHAVQVFDFGLTDDGQPYLVMELLHGEPLSSRIERERRVSPSATAHFMNAAAKALHRAHALGIVHRDFKPDNIFLTKGEDQEVEVKVVDFGIAKLIGSLDEARPSASDFAEISGKALSTLTRTGKLVGTPHYMSPEQVRMSAEVGPAADIWALGVVAFEALTGQCPFDGNSVIELFAKIQLGKYRDPRELNPNLPDAFEEWFKIACATEPSLRFSDAQLASTALADALGVSLIAIPAPDASNPRLQAASSTPNLSSDASAVSSTDALSRSPKVTLLSSATDRESLPKKSLSTGWWVALSIVLGFIGMGAARYVGQRDRAERTVVATAQTPSSAPTASAAPSASAVASVAIPTVATGAVASALEGRENPNLPPNTDTGAGQNAGKVHASGSHGRGARPAGAPADSVTATPTAASATTPSHPAATPTASAASPFALPPLGI